MGAKLILLGYNVKLFICSAQYNANRTNKKERIEKNYRKTN